MWAIRKLGPLWPIYELILPTSKIHMYAKFNIALCCSLSKGCNEIDWVCLIALSGNPIKLIHSVRCNMFIWVARVKQASCQQTWIDISSVFAIKQLILVICLWRGNHLWWEQSGWFNLVKLMIWLKHKRSKRSKIMIIITTIILSIS